jgi:hypothetical protein
MRATPFHKSRPARRGRLRQLCLQYPDGQLIGRADQRRIEGKNTRSDIGGPMTNTPIGSRDAKSDPAQFFQTLRVVNLHIHPIAHRAAKPHAKGRVIFFGCSDKCLKQSVKQIIFTRCDIDDLGGLTRRTGKGLHGIAAKIGRGQLMAFQQDFDGLSDKICLCGDKVL